MSEWVTDRDPPEGRGNPLRKESVRCLVYIPSNPQQYRLCIARYLPDRKHWIVEGSYARPANEIARWRSLEGLHKHKREKNEDSGTSQRVRRKLLKNGKQTKDKRTMGDLDAGITFWSYDGEL